MDVQKKTLPQQWHRIHSSWRFLHALLPYLGPPIYTLHHIFVPVLTVMVSISVDCVGLASNTPVASTVCIYNNSWVFLVVDLAHQQAAKA